MNRFLAAAFAACLLFAVDAQADTTIVITRHAEKPVLGLGQLTCQGLQRALALPAVVLAKYGVPAAIYAANPAVKMDDKGVPYNYIRPLATIEPLAIRVGQPVYLDWAMTETPALADALLQRDGLQVVAWEHHWAATLARQLVAKAGGTAQVPAWPDDDFDSFYVVKVTPEGVTFTRESQGLNGRPDVCPGA